MATEPNRPQTIGQVLDTSIELFKLTFRRLWWLYVPLALLSAAPTMYSLLTASTKTIIGVSAAQGAAYWILSLAVYLLSFFVYAVTTLCAVEIARDQEPDVRGAMSKALRKLPAQLVIGICLALLVAIGFVLFIVPGLILSVSLMLAFLLSLVEDLGPFAAIARSHRLVWGMWWRSFAILSIVFLIWAVFYMAAGTLVGGLVAVFRSSDMMYNLVMGSAFIAVVLNVFSVPFLTAGVLAIYWDLRVRKEADDIATRIDALPAASTAAA